MAKPVFWLLGALIIFTPLFRAGATPLAALVAQLLSVAVLVLVLWWPKHGSIKRSEALVLGLLLLSPLLYLVPLPSGLVGGLPGRALYGAATEQLPAVAPIKAQALSLFPGATAAAGLALLVPVAVFLGVRCLDGAAALKLATLLIALAALQAILGLVQYGTARTGEALFAVGGASAHSATGTYANRNHLAGLIEMALPLTLALFFYSVGRPDRFRGVDAIRRKAAFLASNRGTAAVAYGAVTLLLLVGLIFTRSRTGILLAIVGIVLSALLYARRIGGSNVFGPAGTMIALALSFGIAIGLAPVLDRFSLGALADDARWQVFALTLTRVAETFPFGNGPGTFPWAFPSVQPIELGASFINRVHNDYLEWLFDVGAVAALLIVIIPGLYCAQWTRVYRQGEWSRARFVQVAAGIGLLLIAFHEFVDYNLFNPANQVAFALLAGLFFMPVHKYEMTESTARKRKAPKLSGQTPRPASALQVPVDQIENPFRNGL